jgi:hypothetical protein
MTVTTTTDAGRLVSIRRLGAYWAVTVEGAHTRERLFAREDRARAYASKIIRVDHDEVARVAARLGLGPE